MINLKEIIKYTEQNPHIIDINSEFLKDFGNDEWGLKCFYNQHTSVSHGYFTLLHNITKNLSDNSIIVELGSREAISDVAILCALKPTQTFYSIDIIYDYRYVNKSLIGDNFKIIIGDCLNKNTIDQIEDGIDLIFLDTIHTYEQVKKEFDLYKSKLNDGCIVLIDDIKLNDKGIFFEELTYEKYDISELCHSISGFGAFIYKK